MMSRDKIQQEAEYFSDYFKFFEKKPTIFDNFFVILPLQFVACRRKREFFSYE